jgi:chaperonin GroES
MCTPVHYHDQDVSHRIVSIIDDNPGTAGTLEGC